VVATPAADSVCGAPDTPTPDVTVVMVWGAKPLVPVKLNEPTPPVDTLVIVIVGEVAAQAAGTVIVLALVETVPPNARALPVTPAPRPIATPAASRMFPT